ncbi:DUF721 domain-containing protein [Nocardia sp. NPDC059240]|uniref:DUF721 domain-containing protein n=1 Tax=Nocardia sp. NPDC059240 TaxID=3346786 RepID=UPI00367B2C76
MDLFANWPEAVGKDVAAHCRPVQLAGGVLTVETESTAWSTQLNLYKAQLLARIRTTAGPDAVITDLRFERSPTAARRANGRRYPQPRPDENAAGMWDAKVQEVAGADHAIRELHSRIEYLATLASHAYVSHAPLRIENHDGRQIAHWYDDNELKIFTSAGTVHMSPAPGFPTGTTGKTLSNAAAREIANALWSAARHVDHESDRNPMV